MNTPTKAQYRQQERHISNLIQATKFFVVELGATDEELVRLFAAQAGFARKMVELNVMGWRSKEGDGEPDKAVPADERGA